MTRGWEGGGEAETTLASAMMAARVITVMNERGGNSYTNGTQLNSNPFIGCVALPPETAASFAVERK